MNTPPRTLPPHPDLDQLRRQAKDLLEAFRAGDTTAIAEVQAHYRGAESAALAARCAAGAGPRLRIRQLAQAEGVCRWRHRGRDD